MTSTGINEHYIRELILHDIDDEAVLVTTTLEDTVPHQQTVAQAVSLMSVLAIHYQQEFRQK